MTDTITNKTSIMEAVTKYPETVEVFANYGMGCIGCVAAKFENIEQAAAVHGLDVEKLVKDLNAAVSEKKE